MEFARNQFAQFPQPVMSRGPRRMSGARRRSMMQTSGQSTAPRPMPSEYPRSRSSLHPSSNPRRGCWWTTAGPPPLRGHRACTASAVGQLSAPASWAGGLPARPTPRRLGGRHEILLGALADPRGSTSSAQGRVSRVPGFPGRGSWGLGSFPLGDRPSPAGVPVPRPLAEARRRPEAVGHPASLDRFIPAVRCGSLGDPGAGRKG